MNSDAPYDVAILGGGLAGLTLCRQLLMKQDGIRIAVLEKRSFPVAETTHKVGESTVEIGAHYFGEQLQLKKHLTDDQLPKFGLRFFFREPFQSISEGTEVGGSEFFAAPSYQVDRGRLENYLAAANSEAGADLLAPALVRDVRLASSDEPGADQLHAVAYEIDGERRELRARWIVDATGRFSVLKRRLGLEDDLHHDINAAWFRVQGSIRVDDWCEDPDWRTLVGRAPRRWLSTNHLMGPGYWVWLIPLATGSTSVGIVADPRLHPLREFNSLEKAFDWLGRYEPECASSLAPYRDKVQDFLAIKNMSRGAKQVYSADRWALTGEAAAFLDPFYSPGSDFIAIGNQMIGKLIEDDLAGRSIEHVAPALQSVFLTLFHNNLLTYRDQYPLFGNPRIMAAKFVWDYAVYWGFPALLYFREKLTDIAFIQSLSKGVEEIRELNREMQAFFQRWHEAEPCGGSDAAFVDQSKIDIMTRLNAELLEPLDDAALAERFRRNVGWLRALSREVMSRCPAPDASAAAPLAAFDDEPQLQQLFAPLNI